MGPMPLWPWTRACQFSSIPTPSGVTSPIPVMTTLRMSSPKIVVGGPTNCQTRDEPSSRGTARRFLLLDVRLHVIDRVLDGLDLLGVLVGDLDVEGLLEREHELDDGQGVRLEIVDEGRRAGELLRRDLELRADDVLDLALDLLRVHVAFLVPWGWPGTYLNPWPGSPSHHRAAPREPGAEGAEQEGHALLHGSVAQRLIERDRDRRRRRVPVLLDVPVELRHRQPEPLGHALDDAQVGLVRDHEVDVAGAQV